MTVVEVEVDGRRLRREQNRDAVLDALTELFAEGVYQPNANEIADRAGISARSLFRYFDDVEDLSRAAIERQVTAALSSLEHGASIDDDLTTRVERLVAARTRLFDVLGPAARAARVCAHRNPTVAEQLRAMRTRLRADVRDLFAAELRAPHRAALLPSLDVLSSFESYELLRTEHGMSRRRVAEAMAAGIHAVLTSGAG